MAGINRSYLGYSNFLYHGPPLSPIDPRISPGPAASRAAAPRYHAPAHRGLFGFQRRNDPY